MAEPPKRRVSLTVLQQHDPTGAEDLEEPRAPLAWVGLGALAIFAALVPLAMVVAFVVHAIYGRADGSLDPRSYPLLAVSSLLTIATASGCGGYLVGRFGPLVQRRPPIRHAAGSGLVAGVVMALLSLRAGAGAVAWVSLVVVVVTTPAAYVGGRIGNRARSPLDG